MGAFDKERTLMKRRMRLGENIHIARRRAKLSQDEVAQKLGCSRHKVYRVETGKADFTIFEILDLAKILGVSLEFFSRNLDETRPGDNDRVSDFTPQD